MFKSSSLTPSQRHVLLDRGTDQPIISEQYDPEQQGTFLCRLCGQALFRSFHKFQASCGWPSFDDEISKRLIRKQDADGRRTEIVCSRCDGHLGHVFEGEFLTQKNLRNCVNSTSLDFVDNKEILDSEEIIVAGGCFWGIDNLLSSENGVVKSESGYIGGKLEHPTYKDICMGSSGYLEAVRIVFDTTITTIDSLYKAFFESHDPFQFNGQGVNIGMQYQSAVFTYSEKQTASIRSLILRLEHKYKAKVSTMILPVKTFWPAEESHQYYYKKHPNSPICHIKIKRFDKE